MARKAPKVSSVAASAGEDMHGRYAGMWGFVDERIKHALIDATVMSWVRLQCDEFFIGKSAQELWERIELWRAETARYIAVKYLMYVDDVAECEIKTVTGRLIPALPEPPAVQPVRADSSDCAAG